MGPLIGADELIGILDRVHVLDVRWSLADPVGGRSRYLAGHVPGAVFVDLDRDLSAATGPGRHPLPAPEDFTATLGRLGLGPADEAIVYDDAGGTVAARLWWMLTSVGHERSRLLDGGWGAWKAAGGPVEPGESNHNPVPYPGVSRWSGTLTREELWGRTLVDARARERYRGEIEPVDPKAGHIPGAINIPATENLTEAGHFRPRQELAKVYAGIPDDVVVSCGSGVTACHDALAMLVAGRALPDLYVGSFSDWCSDDLPVSIGSEP